MLVRSVCVWAGDMERRRNSRMKKNAAAKDARITINSPMTTISYGNSTISFSPSSYLGRLGLESDRYIQLVIVIGSPTLLRTAR